MVDHASSARKLQAEFNLVRCRQRALRIAMVLFDKLNDAEVITYVAELLDQSSRIPSKEQVEAIVRELQHVAAVNNIALPESS